MSFARAKRETLFDLERKNKENLPGPDKYNPRHTNHVNGFKYVNTTASTISGSILERSQDDIDLHRICESTPKRSRTSTTGGSASFLNRTNLQAKKATREHVMQLAVIRDLTAENDRLKAQYQKVMDLKDELEQEYMSARGKSEQFSSIEETYKNKIQQKDNEIYELKSSCHIIEEKITELRVQEEKAHRDNVENQSKNLDLLKRCESEQTKIKQLQDLVENKGAQLEKVQLEQFNDRESRKSFELKSQSSLAQFKEERSRFNEERSRLVNEIEDQKIDMQELKQIVEQRNEEIANLNHQHEEKYELTEEYMATTRQLEAEKETLMIERTQRDSENEKLLAQIELLKSNETDMVLQLDELKISGETHTEEHTMSIKELAEAKETNNALEMQLADLNGELKSSTASFEVEKLNSLSKISSFQIEMDAMKQSIAEKDTQLEAQRESFQIEMDAMKQSIAEKDTQLEAQREAVLEINEKIVQVEMVNQTANATILKQQEGIDQYKQQLVVTDQKLASEHADFSKTLNEQKELNSDLLVQAQVSEETIATLTLGNQNVQEKFNELEQVVKSLNSQLDELKNLNQDLKMSNDKLSNDVSIKHTEVSDLQKEFAILVQKKNKLVSEKEKLRVGGLQYKNKRDGIKDAYDKLLEETTEDQNKRTAETETIKRLTERLTETSEELENYKNAKSASDGKIRGVTDQLRIVRADAAKEKIINDGLNQRLSEIDGMESRLVAAQATAADWKDRWEELNNFISPFRQDLAKYAEESQHLKHENRNKAMELKDLHNKIAGQMGHQNNRQKIHYLTKVKSENAELRQQLESSQLELKKSRRQIEALNEDVNGLRGVRRFDPKKAFQH